MIGLPSASGKKEKMSDFAVRDLSEKTVATFRDFEEAWNHLVINLENEGDIVEEEKEKRAE
jgi:hypothetical protein